MPFMTVIRWAGGIGAVIFYVTLLLAVYQRTVQLHNEEGVTWYRVLFIVAFVLLWLFIAPGFIYGLIAERSLWQPILGDVAMGWIVATLGGIIIFTLIWSLATRLRQAK